MAYASAARAIPQGLRMAGQVLRNIGLTAAANPRASATIGALGGSALLGGIHGRKAGYADPYAGGLGGTLGYSVIGGLPAGIAYNIGQATGSQRAKDHKLQALDQAVLGGGAAGTAAVGASPAEQNSYQDYLNEIMIQDYIQRSMKS